MAVDLEMQNDDKKEERQNKQLETDQKRILKCLKLLLVCTYEPGTLRLSNHPNAKHSVLGSVCKFFVRLGSGHYNE